MGGEEVRVVVRVPIGDLEAALRRKYGIKTALLDTVLESESLVLAFAGGSLPKNGFSTADERPNSLESVRLETDPRPTRRRRRRRTRLRTKTRGWLVVAKFVNKKGQSCSIYKPMYDALETGQLPKREARAVIREILEANGNNPTSSSIEYYLENTLEYIAHARRTLTGTQ